MEVSGTGLALLVIFVLLSALFSASETALVSLSKTRILALMKSAPSKAKAWHLFLDNPQRVLVAILIGNNLVNIAASAIATSLSLKIFPKVGVSVAVGVMTFIILLFGEITPKGLALRYAEDIAKRVIYPAYILSLVTYPIVIGFSKVVESLGGSSKRFLYPLITREELELLLSRGEEVELEEEERKMIKSVIDLEDKIVREIMVPRLDMVCLEASLNVRDAVKVVEEYGYSRIPVFEGNIDNIVGMLYAKDLLPVIVTGNWDEKVSKLIRPPYFVPETKPVRELFDELRQKKIHMAIVIDEYGGTAGLVTMEDIIEEIVGEIEDEYDREPPVVERVNDMVYVVDGKVNLDELFELFGMEMDAELEERDYNTVAGFLFSVLGRIPKQNEEVTFKGLRFKVLEVKKNRIKKVLVSKEEGNESEED